MQARCCRISNIFILNKFNFIMVHILSLILNYVPLHKKFQLHSSKLLTKSELQLNIICFKWKHITIFDEQISIEYFCIAIFSCTTIELCIEKVAHANKLNFLVSRKITIFDEQIPLEYFCIAIFSCTLQLCIERLAHASMYNFLVSRN